MTQLDMCSKYLVDINSPRLSGSNLVSCINMTQSIVCAKYKQISKYFLSKTEFYKIWIVIFRDLQFRGKYILEPDKERLQAKLMEISAKYERSFEVKRHKVRCANSNNDTNYITQI